MSGPNFIQRTPRPPHYRRESGVVLLVLLVLLMSGLPIPAVANEVEPPLLDLDQAITLALEGNHSLRAAEARRETAAAGVDEARAERRPRLDLVAAYQRTDNPTLVFSNKLAQGIFGPEDFAIDQLNEPAAIDHFATRLRFAQPLWTGGRLRFARQAADQGYEAADAALEARRQRLVYEVTEAHSGAVLAAAEVTVTRQAHETAGAHVALARDLFEAGLVVESDVLSAELRQAELTERVIRAESRLEVARAGLNAVLGRDLITPFRLPETLVDPVLLSEKEGEAADLEALIARAQEQHPALLVARQQSAAAESAWRLQRAGRLPVVGLEAMVEANGEDFFGADGDNVTLGVGLEWNLDGQRRRARTRAAAAAHRESLEGVAQLADGIALEVRSAERELRAARAAHQQAERGIALAERSRIIIEDRYREGLTTLTELLDAEIALTQAQMRRLAARRDVLLSHTRLRLAVGEL